MQGSNEPKKDQNGDLCAILKIVTTQKGFTFDCGQIGIVKNGPKNHLKYGFMYLLGSNG